MALSSLSTLTSGTNTTNAASHATASISPTGGALLVACFMCAANVASIVCTSVTDTLTGTGTWTVLTAQGISSSRRVNVVLAYAQAGSSPGSGAITFNFDNSVNRNTWFVGECTGFDTTTPVQQNKTNSGDASTTLTITLDSTPASTSMIVGVVSENEADGTITPGGTFTESVDLTSGGGGFQGGGEVQYDLVPGAGTAVGWSSLVGSGFAIGYAIEINEASVGGGDPEGPLVGGKLVGGGILIKGRLV